MLYKVGDLKNVSKLQVQMFLTILQNTQKNVFAEVPFSENLHAGNLKLSEAATGDVLQKKVFLKRCIDVSEQAVHETFRQNRRFWMIHKIHIKKSELESLFNKVAVLRTCNFVKENSNTGAFL